MKYYKNDLVRVAKRENNKKRSYLLVNPLQGKHIAVSPSKALSLFDSLAYELKDKYKDENLLIIGFAETATAIGAQVAIFLQTKYIQTTREVIPNVEYLFFSEEHSHATEQKLVKDDIDKEIENADRIIFVEDEVTTGKTILNIIKVLKNKYSKNMKFAVASLINGMDEEHVEVYGAENIDIYYLVKTNNSKYEEIAKFYAEDGKYMEANDSIIDKPEIKNIKGYMDARRAVEAREYEKACKNLSYDIINNLKVSKASSILVIGTEEFMFPALYVGKTLEEKGYSVCCHATTRSPITVSKDIAYPLHERYTLVSFYDSNRKTFIYDINHYDQVIVITDAFPLNEKGLDTLICALQCKNTKIDIYRWC